MNFSRLNIPTDTEPPYRFRQRIDGVNYRIRISRRPAVGGRYGGVQLSIGDRDTWYERDVILDAGNPVGVGVLGLDVVILPVFRDGEERDVTIGRLQDRDCELVVVPENITRDDLDVE